MRLRWIHRIMKRHGESERQQSTEIGTFPGVCFGKEAVSDPCIASKWVFFLVDNVLLLCFALHCFLSEVGVLHCKSSVVISYSCPEGQYAFVLEVSSSEGSPHCSFSWNLGYIVSDGDDQYIYYDRHDNRGNTTAKQYVYCVSQRNVFVSFLHEFTVAAVSES